MCVLIVLEMVLVAAEILSMWLPLFLAGYSLNFAAIIHEHQNVVQVPEDLLELKAFLCTE